MTSVEEPLNASRPVADNQHWAQPAQVAAFASPLTRMLLAGNGLTTPVLEAALDTALQVRVLRQDDVSGGEIPDGIARDLRLTSGDRAVVRRSCLVDSGMTEVSVNLVVATVGAATAKGIDRVDTPIGYSLVAAGASQYRRTLRVGLARWPDGRMCATKAYLVLLGDQPLCYIRECFNPSLISPDLSSSSHRESLNHAWDEDPIAVPLVDVGVNSTISLPNIGEDRAQAGASGCSAAVLAE
jgi:3-deoxy-7-phosphoheptulonate synthase